MSERKLKTRLLYDFQPLWQVFARGLSHFASFIRSTKVRLMSLFLHKMAEQCFYSRPLKYLKWFFPLGDEEDRQTFLAFISRVDRLFKIKLISVDYRRDVQLTIISPGVLFPHPLTSEGEGGNFFVALNISMYVSKTVEN